MYMQNNIYSQKDSYHNMLRLMYSPLQRKIYLMIPVMTDYTYLPTQFTSYYHIHPVYHLVFILDGKGYLNLSNNRIRLTKNDIILINPMKKHIFSTQEQHLNYFTFNFYLIPIASSIDIIEKYINNYVQKNQNIESFSETEKLENIININLNQCVITYNKEYCRYIQQDIVYFRNSIQDHIHSLRFSSGNTATFCDYANRAFDFFTQLTSRYFAKNAPLYNHNIHHDRLIQKIVNYLENNLEQKLDLKSVADKLEYNAAYLSNHFSTQMNMTISEYFNKLKINKACEYLKYTSMSITDISNILGYSSSQHFSRKFKDAKKITPREYRNNIELY